MRLWSPRPPCTATPAPSTPTTIPVATTLRVIFLPRQRISQPTRICPHLCLSTASPTTPWPRLLPVPGACGSGRPYQSCTALTSTCRSTTTPGSRPTRLEPALPLPSRAAPLPHRPPPWAPGATGGATPWATDGTTRPQPWTTCPCRCTRPRPPARTCQRAARSRRP